MNIRKTNQLYLAIVATMLTLIVVFNLGYRYLSFQPGIIVSNFLSEMSAFVPAIIFVLCEKDSIKDLVPFKKIKITSVLLVLLYLICLMPLVSFVNALSMLFVDNEVLSWSSDILSHPYPLMIFSIGIFGPFVEEFVFRGVIFHGYRKSGRVLGSVLMSSLLFGLMHMNFNQAAYAFVIGIMFALLVEATGSVLTSFIAHAVFNSFEVTLMYVQSSTSPESMEMARELVSEQGSGSYMLMAAAVSGVIAVITTILALCLVYRIAVNEKREWSMDAILHEMHRRKKTPDTMVVVKNSFQTLPLAVSLVLAIGYMVFVQVIRIVRR